MQFTQSKPLFNITVPKPEFPVTKATVESVSRRPKVTTEQALRGYDYLKSLSALRWTQIAESASGILETAIVRDSTSSRPHE